MLKIPKDGPTAWKHPVFVMAVIAANSMKQTVSRLVNIASPYGLCIAKGGIVLNLAGLADYLVRNENSGQIQMQANVH